jgi:hypothetical protein
MTDVFISYAREDSGFVQRLCRVAGRSLTEAEWAEFVTFKPYEPGCPSLRSSS